MCNKHCNNEQKITHWVYKNTPMRCYLVGTFNRASSALDYALNCSIQDEINVFAVVNPNGVCIGKYRNSKYSI